MAICESLKPIYDRDFLEQRMPSIPTTETSFEPVAHKVGESTEFVLIEVQLLELLSKAYANLDGETDDIWALDTPPKSITAEMRKVDFVPIIPIIR